MDGGESTQDGFGARQEGRGFVEGNSVVEVDRGVATEVDLRDGDSGVRWGN